MKRNWRVALIVCFFLLIVCGGSYANTESETTWIVKWEDRAPNSFWQETTLIREYEELGVMLVKPAQPIDADEWLEKWSADPSVSYIQENQPLILLASPNDPFISEQLHLDIIGLRQAWDVASENTKITIAIVDTGVDLDHPDLVDNLVPGHNVLDPKQLPDDDAGHGTKVAGVLAAVGNNNVGVTGVLWNAQIMPIKVMDARGNGREADLAEGIRHAVDHGADIIVLSLGLYRYSTTIEEVVQYAEEQGVLLVAASGNDGQEVQYPAAYPTVIAVGGVNAKNEVYPTSNYGPELDLVAPWQVYTTMRGGDYIYDQGTSMATPQVAGVAALILSQHPDLKPYQVRNYLRQTAQDIGPTGWDARSGYGLVRADRALTMAYKEDFYEPNNTAATSKQLPLGKMSSAEISSQMDVDWFFVEPDFDGTVTITAEANSQAQLRNLQLTHYDGTPSSNNRTVFTDLSETIEIPVSANKKSYIALSAKGAVNQPIGYRITTQFQMSPDDFESNDFKYSATTLLPRENQVIVGNFHQENDQDWFVLNIREEGILNVDVYTDYYRLDTSLRIEKQGNSKPLVVKDQWGPGESESSGSIEVQPGRYYIMVSNVISPVIGEYELRIRYEPKYSDPNEPNDEPSQALSMVNNTDYFGVIDTDDDEDWFSFRITETSYITLVLDNIPDDKVISLSLYPRTDTKEPIAVDVNQRGVRKIEATHVLEPGTYYVKLKATEKFENQQYRFRLIAESLELGYRDIAGHWALNEILELTDRQIVTGYLDYTFRPNSPITRAEATMMIGKAIELAPKSNRSPRYRDVTDKHWAFEAIQYASRAEMVAGYPDGHFYPSRELTRAEMTVMLAKALELEPLPDGKTQFTDIPQNHWATGYINRMAAEGWIAGYGTGEFKPNASATRAELSSLIYRLLQLN